MKISSDHLQAYTDRIDQIRKLPNTREHQIELMFITRVRNIMQIVLDNKVHGRPDHWVEWYTGTINKIFEQIVRTNMNGCPISVNDLMVWDGTLMVSFNEHISTVSGNMNNMYLLPETK